MNTHPRALILVLSAAVSGCTLSHLSPQARFSESAYVLNDASRWGQVDLASSHVTGPYREQFRARRRDWGDRINVAEVELLRLQLAEDKDTAVSEVSLSWYDAAGMTLRKSLVTQRWENHRGTFRLAEETVSRGDPRVFAD